jgi:hypothetical protein
MQKYAIWGGAGLLAIAAIAYLLYASDWRLGENWLPTRTGSISVVASAGSSVFIDNRKMDISGDGSEAAVAKVIPGVRTVLVSKEGHWPWTKKVILESRGAVELHSFTVPSSPNARVIDKSEAEYKSAVTAVASHPLPTSDKPLISEDKTIEVYIEDNNVRARWIGNEEDRPSLFCEGPCGPIDVLRPEKSDVRDIAFFGSRSDVIIVAVTNGVFAIDLNPIGTQNFQPMYLGTEPTFAPVDTKTLYIKDTSYYIHLEY